MNNKFIAVKAKNLKIGDEIQRLPIYNFHYFKKIVSIMYIYNRHEDTYIIKVEKFDKILELDEDDYVLVRIPQ